MLTTAGVTSLSNGARVGFSLPLPPNNGNWADAAFVAKTRTRPYAHAAKILDFIGTVSCTFLYGRNEVCKIDG
jgi:hypothetical protein